MRSLYKDNMKRYVKLPFKFVYLVLCVICFLLSCLFVMLTKKRRHKAKTYYNKAICLSHVSISFDGRIKKSANQILKCGVKVVLIKPWDAQEDRLLQYSGLDPRVKIKPLGLSGVFSHFPYTFDLCMFLYVLCARATYVHCHDILTSLMGLVVAKTSGKILICDLHEWKSQTTQTNDKDKKIRMIEGKIYQFVEKQVLEKADFVLAPNELIATEMKAFHQCERDIFVVKNIPDFTELKPYNMRKDLKIGADSLVVYYIGQLAPFRNIENILKAMTSYPDIVFVLQGTIEKWYEHTLTVLCNALKITDRVHILPPIPHDFIPSACQGADIGIFTCHAIGKSMYYSLPNKLFEYISGAIPIISEDLPVVRPYILENNIGLLVDSREIATLEKAFETYLKDRNMLELHKKNIRTFKNIVAHDTGNADVYAGIYKPQDVC